MFGLGIAIHAAADAPMGEIWFFLPSEMNICFISLTLSGDRAATSCDWLKSVFRSYSSSAWLLSGPRFAGPKASQGACLTLALSNQSSWYSAYCLIILKHWVLCWEGCFAFPASNVCKRRVSSIRLFTIPVWANQETVSRFVAGGAANYVAIVVCVSINQLHGEVAVFGNCGNGKNRRLRLQI